MARRRTSPKLHVFLVLGIPVIVFVLALGTFLVGTMVISNKINATREARTCTIEQVLTPGQGGGRALFDGKPSWLIKTDCGGTLYIDPDATGQTAAEATELAGSLQPGQKYKLKIQGQLDNKFTISSYLLSATPAS